jgi:hypothetical protein
MGRNDESASPSLRALSEQDALHVIEHLYQLHHQPARTLDPRVAAAATRAATEPEPGPALAEHLAALVTAADDPVLPGPRGGALPAALRNLPRGPGGAVLLFSGSPDQWPE